MCPLDHIDNTAPGMSSHAWPPVLPPVIPGTEASLRGARPPGKIYPSRAPAVGRGRRVGGRGGLAVPARWLGDAPARRGDRGRSPAGDTPHGNRRVPGRKADKSRTAGGTAGNRACEAASPRPRGPGTRFTPWTAAETDAILCTSNTSPRVRHEGPENSTLRALTYIGSHRRTVHLTSRCPPPAPRRQDDQISTLLREHRHRALVHR